jgi:nucleotide sugar dehydrogenase
LNVGIVGQGFVGTAVKEGLKDYHNVLAYDIDPSKSMTVSLEQVVNHSEILFVCLPTPMRPSGECDIRILQDAMFSIDNIAALASGKKKIVVVKSTVPPGTTDSLNDSCQNIKVVFSPEFLTEANSFEDFKNQTRIIIGGDGAKKVKQMFRKPFPNIPIVITRANTAEMVKYFINCFLSTKVTFANQMYDLCEASGIDYDKVCEYALLDQRIGGSHLAVPGPDGDRGYGGHCFPKDMSAMIYFGKLFDVSFDLFSQVVKSNSTYRKNKDWLDMKGRAVSED